MLCLNRKFGAGSDIPGHAALSTLLGSIGLVTMMVWSLHWNMSTLLMRNLMTLILMTLLSVTSRALFLVGHLSTFMTMILHLYCTTLHRFSNNLLLALGLCNSKVTHLARFLSFLTAVFLPLVFPV